VDEERLSTHQLLARLVQAADNASANLERLCLLRQHELGVEIRYQDGDPYVSKGPEKSNSDA
jgi:hypothetical protein